MALSRPPIRHLRRESQLPQQPPDVIMVVPHVELPPDHVCDPLGASCFIGETVLQSTLPQEGANLFELSGGESGGASGGHRCLNTAAALQPLFPVADGVYGDTEVLGDLLL